MWQTVDTVPEGRTVLLTAVVMRGRNHRFTLNPQPGAREGANWRGWQWPVAPTHWAPMPSSAIEWAD